MPKKPLGKNFSTAVSDLIDQKFGGIAQNLADASGLNPSTIAYYRRSGGRFPSSSQLKRIVDAVDEEWQRRLVMAFLKDLIPEGMEHLVKFSGVKGEQPVKGQSAIPKPVEKVLDQIRDAAHKDQNVRHWILATGKAMFPES